MESTDLYWYDDKMDKQDCLDQSNNLFTKLSLTNTKVDCWGKGLRAPGRAGSVSNI
jgi:hypothetical protein